MAGEGPDPAVCWLLRVCPSCRGKCRARTASAGKALRCPRCGAVIPPAHPRPGPVPAEPARGKPAPRSAAGEEFEDIPYAARAPEAIRSVEAPEPDAVEDVAVRRKRPPAPVAPLWWGVYGFPWHPCALRAWFLFGIGLSLVALMGGALHYTLDLYLASDLGRGGIWARVYLLYLKGFVLFLLWTGAYAGSFFLATIQDTAAGSHEVGWPD